MYFTIWMVTIQNKHVIGANWLDEMNGKIWHFYALIPIQARELYSWQAFTFIVIIIIIDWVFLTWPKQ